MPISHGSRQDEPLMILRTHTHTVIVTDPESVLHKELLELLRRVRSPYQFVFSDTCHLY